MLKWRGTGETSCESIKEAPDFDVAPCVNVGDAQTLFESSSLTSVRGEAVAKTSLVPLRLQLMTR